MRTVGLLIALVALFWCSPSAARAQGVTISEDSQHFYLSNGIVSARVSKSTGSLSQMGYKGTQVLHPSPSSGFVFWSHDVRGGVRIETRITIDPRANGGGFGEVSVKGVSGGRNMGFGPGAPPEGDVPVDIEIRYALGAGDSAIYTYSIFEHLPEYPGGDFTEARVAAILNPFFDTIHVDKDRNGRYPLFNEDTDKYVYAANQYDSRVFGFTSTSQKIGWFMLLPSTEFLSGGPTKPELMAHGTSPTVLTYWRSSHYGGANITLKAGEHWRRVVGPIALFVTEGQTANDMWLNAAIRNYWDSIFWPFGWVNAPGFVPANQRSTVRGGFLYFDLFAPNGPTRQGDLFVGLTKAPYDVTTDGVSRTITWQTEGKDPQYWVRSADWTFSIPNVPPGRYTLSAFADGVLGEFVRQDIEVPASGEVDLGQLLWVADRKGMQVWEIGKPDRSPLEFAGADKYFIPGQALRYAAMFPNGIEFRIGQSVPERDWHYSHMPHATNPDAEIIPFGGVAGGGETATRNIRFSIPDVAYKTALLRIAVSGTGAQPFLALYVNGTYAGLIGFGQDDGSMTRHQSNGVWKLVDTPISKALLRPGENTISLSVPGGSLTKGVIYDYLRFEIAN